MSPLFTKTPGTQWQTISHKVFETRQFDYQGYLTVENNLNVEKDAFRRDTRKYTNSQILPPLLAVCTTSSSFSLPSLRLNLQKKINRVINMYCSQKNIYFVCAEDFCSRNGKLRLRKLLTISSKPSTKRNLKLSGTRAADMSTYCLQRSSPLFRRCARFTTLCFDRETCYYWLLCHNRLRFVGEMCYWHLQVAKVNR